MSATLPFRRLSAVPPATVGAALAGFGTLGRVVARVPTTPVAGLLRLAHIVNRPADSFAHPTGWFGLLGGSV